MRTLFLLAIALTMSALSPTVQAAWNFDFQGANTTYNGQVGPVDYVFPGFFWDEAGNYITVQGLTDADPPLYDSTPKTWSSLVDSNGTPTGVAFSFLAPSEGTEDLVGWAGTIVPGSEIKNQQGLNTDNLIIYPADNALGIITDGSYDFEITGLSASTKYRIGLAAGNNLSATRGVDFSFNGGATCSIQNTLCPTAYVTVQTDAAGKIVGTASIPTGFTEGNWAGMTIDEMSSKSVVRRWNLDIGGDGTYTANGQDDHPHPHEADEFGQWNVMDVPATHGASTPTVTDPLVVMDDNTGSSTGAVTFKLIGEVAGWTGISGEDTGLASLVKDDLILKFEGSASGLPNHLDFEMTGLTTGEEYALTFVGGVTTDTRRHLHITADLNGNSILTDESYVVITSMFNEETVYFTANAEGKLIGALDFPGSTGEGNLAGIRLALLSDVVTPGDTNNDHQVDEFDARTLASHWLMDVPLGDVTQGDFNGDGKVDDLDASILAANWTGTGEGSAVPEPSCFVLLLGILLGLGALRTRQRRC
ncbi:MAG: hypothetical protein JW818_13155 [Pirellulales bacterium]|nr:hypothetical protein [Pirellulales bacterium]